VISRFDVAAKRRVGCEKVSLLQIHLYLHGASLHAKFAGTAPGKMPGHCTCLVPRTRPGAMPTRRSSFEVCHSRKQVRRGTGQCTWLTTRLWKPAWLSSCRQRATSLESPEAKYSFRAGSSTRDLKPASPRSDDDRPLRGAGRSSETPVKLALSIFGRGHDQYFPVR